ncbi:MAG: glycosyltransferase family 2 protein, partial [Roseinatronobacter sp.]
DIRAAWGKTLADWGIPLVTVVGRAAGQRPGAGHVFDGQVLHLDVPDDYEGLPQKTLALTEWVLHRSGFGRVFKIDDDCFLDVEAFFSDPAFLTVHYFGRPLRRGPGDMDRAWHMLRATGLRGRYELDKSPEPSRYADGGSGYVLNRTALLALQDMRATVRGRALEQVSFMEDKLVGDLLSAAGIDVAGPGYDLAIFRKAAPSLPAIPQFSDGFLPFKGARTKLAHLDGGISAQSVAQARQSPWPMPMKVWPLQRAAGLGWAKHGLTLVSPAEQLERAEAADCAVVAVMRDEAFMVEHFLTHYRRLGVGGFLIVDNGSRDGTLEYLARQPDVALFTTDTPYRDSAYGVIWQEALLAQFRLGKWSLVADADELLFWSLPDAAGRVRGSLPDLLRQPEFATADAARIFMFDLYPKGRLADAQFTRAPFVEASHLDREPLCRDWQGRGPWSNAETCTSALRHRVMREAGVQVRANLFVAQKYALLRYHPFMQLSTGLHYIAGAQIAARDLAFGHFKYHAQFHAKALREAARAQHFNNAEEYRTYLSLQAEGRDTLYQPGTSVPLAQSRAVRDICGLPETDPFASLRSGRAPVTPRTRRPLRYTLALPQQGQGAHVIRAG